MPNIDAFIVSTEKKMFKKKNYRPWDLFGEDDLIQPPPPKPEYLENKWGTIEEYIKKKQEFEGKVIKNKPRTNLGQSQDKPRTNLGQTQDKPRTSLVQNQYKPRTNLGQTQDKPKTKPKTEPRTNLGQSQASPSTNEHLFSLVGLQKEIVFFLYDSCKFSSSKITSPLSMEYVSTNCKTTKYAAQKTIQRLEEMGIIVRNNFKNGRGGWTQYELPEIVFQALVNDETLGKLRTNLGQTQDKPKTEPRTEPRTTPISSSSSSSSSLNTTTTKREGLHELQPDWQMFDFSPLEDIGFGKTHLLQIQKKGLINFQTAQESANAFAFDLKRNQKAKTLNKTPLEFFMGILSKGSPYAPPDNYESPKDEAMRLYTERMQAIQTKREQTEKLAMDLAFEEWVVALPKEEQNRIIPGMQGMKIENVRRATLMHHFRENVWPELRAQVV